VTDVPAPPPFAAVLAPFADAMPPALAQQFLRSDPVRLGGVMHKVWHRPILRPIFWLLGRLGILVGKTGRDIPTTLTVEPVQDGQLFRRSFHFEPTVQFSSLTTYNAEAHSVVEWLGPRNALGMVWNISFRPPGTLVLVTCGWVLRLGRAHLPIPSWLWPWTLGRADTIQYADEDRQDTVHIELVIHHALLGEMFGFTGTFQVLSSES
jgi:hypothetical protein